MSDQPEILTDGFRRVWRYQRVLWWVFFINFILAFFGVMPAMEKVKTATDHSLHAGRLSDMFDLGSFSALMSNPEIDPYSFHGASVHFAMVFLVFALFLTGGTLEAYRANRKLTAREFFEACGSYFWRWVRLLILMVIVLAPVFLLASSLSKVFTKLFDESSNEKLAYWAFFGGWAIVGLLMMCVRLWFDMAQVRAVVEEETGMWRNAGRAFKLTFGNFGSLFWMYFRISALGWIAFAAGLYVWAKMPPARFEWTILVLEMVVLLSFGMRLWQRACEMIWYQRRFLARVAAPVPVVPPPDPLLTIAPPPAQA
jgi:hypothetical protein